MQTTTIHEGMRNRRLPFSLIELKKYSVKMKVFTYKIRKAFCKDTPLPDGKGPQVTGMHKPWQWTWTWGWQPCRAIWQNVRIKALRHSPLLASNATSTNPSKVNSQM